jgi:DNA-binding beta-propeller fold protein YncE
MLLRTFAVVLFCCATLIGQNSNVPLHLVRSFDLPDVSGDMDHLALDAAGGRLFVAAEDNGTLRIIDLHGSTPVQTIKGFNTPHSIYYLPDRKELFITDGSPNVKVLDSNTFTLKKQIATTPGADSITTDPTRHILYTVTGGKDVSMKTSAITAIDVASATKKNDVPIDAAHVEAMALEHSGHRLFVNVTDKNYLAVIDRTQGKVVQQWSIEEAQQNAPLAFDEPNHRLFVVCRQPGKLVVLNSDTGHPVASFPTGARADEVVFDSVHHRIYVAAGEGKIYAYQQLDADRYQPLPQVPSASGAKTALLSPDAKQLFVAVSPGEGNTGAKVLVFNVNGDTQTESNSGAR